MSCTCEKQNFLTAYEDEMDKTLVQMNLNEPTTEARMRVAQNLRPKFALDRHSSEREAKNLSEYEVPEAAFTLTSEGNVLYTKYNRTLDELHTRQQELQPDQYSKDEHDVSTLVQRMFQQGATEVVTSYPRDEGDNRDIVVMRFDPITRIGTTRVINTQVNGKNHEFQTVHGIAKEKFTHLTDVETEKKLFVLSNVSYIQKQTTKNTQHQNSRVSFEDATAFRAMDAVILQQAMDTSHQIQEKVRSDITDTIQGVSRYIQTTQKHQPKTSDIPPFYTRLFGLQKPISTDPVNSNSFSEITPSPRHISVKNTRALFLSHKQTLNTDRYSKVTLQTFGQTRGTEDKTFEKKPVDLMVGEHIIGQQALSSQERKSAYINNRSVLLNGILFEKSRAREVVVREKTKQSKQQQREQKNIRKRVIVETNQLDRNKRLLGGFDKIRRKVKTEKHLIKPLLIQKNRQTEHQKKTQITKKIILNVLVKESSQNINTICEQEVMNKREVYVNERILLRFTQLILLWKSSEQRVDRQEVKSPEEYIKKETNITIQQIETPWILFSIIWYLAMIREQGKVSVSKKPKKRVIVKNKKDTIIFAYDSGSYLPTQSIFVI